MPAAFCWTRIGTEAGQSLQDIMARKEVERTALGGVFLWGIGSAVVPAVRRLAEFDPEPQVLFSPIRSSAAEIDASPTSVVAWTHFLGSDGIRNPLQSGAIVTSRGESGRGTTKRSHYALFCRSLDSIVVRQEGRVDIRRLRNLESKRAVGFSQVTAVVVRDDEAEVDDEHSYRIAFRATLVEPYCAQLVDPVSFDSRDMVRMLTAARTHDADMMRDLSDSLRRRVLRERAS
jgi:hypothetical protein